ncbi:MAG: hypothetical protein ABH896_00490 [Candidatus Jacksonbacteria bacterium]
MEQKDTMQKIEFSPLFFDTLFGLVIFFSLDSFFDIKDISHFIFYLFSTIIVVHWWLMFKSSDDSFGEEVTDSAADLVFGIIYVILLEYVVLFAKDFNYQMSTYYLFALLVLDLIWVTAWKYIGDWHTRDKKKISSMQKELDSNIRVTLFSIVLFIIFIIFGLNKAPVISVTWFILSYLTFIFLTFKYKIINIRIF